MVKADKICGRSSCEGYKDGVVMGCRDRYRLESERRRRRKGREKREKDEKERGSSWPVKGKERAAGVEQSVDPNTRKGF